MSSELELEMDALNTLLKGELSAVESYSKALEKVGDSHSISILEQCLQSHASRVDKLRSAVLEDGGTPVESPGAWGSFTKFLTAAAGSVGGDKAMLTALEEGEDVGLNDYEWTLVRMKGPHRKMVKDELFPKQQATHKLLSKVLNSQLSGVWPPTPEMKEG